MSSDGIGAHMSMAGGYVKAWERATAVGCQALQIFTKNNMRWKAPPLSAEGARAFRRRTAELKHPVCGHACSLINVAAVKPSIAQLSRATLLDEMRRAEALGLPFLVLHPGNHMGAGEDAGLAAAAANIRWALDRSRSSCVKIALENTAGQGTGLGFRFEHLAAIAEKVALSSRVGFCFDTCHAYAAGYDISRPRGLAATLKEFDRLLGLDNLLGFHFNDSKCGLGSRVDRHEHIGKGHIGLDPFREILRTRAFHSTPKILETPKDASGRADTNNLKALRSLRGS
ncbi:MAG: deoxyribonuclease IV [Verrucomicrobiae bacterium]|nr:deoxyribonuclease IV [Verrucomicrobiae bacterium]